MDSVWKKSVGLIGLLLLSTSAMTADIGACAEIESVKKRLACYDDLAGRVQEKIAEVDAKPTSTQEREAIRQEAVAVVIGEKPEADAFKIKRVYRNRLNRITYIADDGRRFKNQASGTSAFRSGDAVRLKEGFLGAKVLVRTDGLRAKVKEISPES